MKCRAKRRHKTYPLKKGPAPLRLGIAEVLEGPWPLMPARQSLTGPLPSLRSFPTPLLVRQAVDLQNATPVLQLSPDVYFSAVKLGNPSAQLPQPL